jgi:hypothetical protein
MPTTAGYTRGELLSVYCSEKSLVRGGRDGKEEEFALVSGRGDE